MASLHFRDILPQSKLAAVYRALIENHLGYGNIIWSCISDTKLDTLQKLQSRGKKLIENGKHKDGWAYDWVPVRRLIKYDRFVMTHKILNGKCPGNLQDKFTKGTKISSFLPQQNIIWYPFSVVYPFGTYLLTAPFSKSKNLHIILIAH